MYNAPAYGASSHYLGEQGKEYFAGQGQVGALAAQWNYRLWVSHVGPSISVLDFGCGGGYLLAALPAKRRVGVEINPAAQAHARQLGLEVHDTLAALGGERFDLIISSHALEHVPCPYQALLGMRRHLRSDGKLVLLLPLDDWRTPAHRSYAPGDVAKHLYNWTPRNLGNLLSEAGYRVVEVRVVRDAMPPTRWLTRAALQREVMRAVVARVTSAALRRRQLLAVAVNDAD